MIPLTSYTYFQPSNVNLLRKGAKLNPHLPSGTSTSETLGAGMGLSRSYSPRQAKSPALFMCAPRQCHKSTMTY